MLLQYRNLLSVYPKLLGLIQQQGRVAHPRGQEVVELPQPLMWHITHPHEYLLTIPGRKLNPFFALAEVVWMWSGKGGLEFISFYNSQMKKYADDNVPYLHGSYGKRVRHYGYNETPFRENLPRLISPALVGRMERPDVEVDQLEFVVSKLNADPDTRQAVVVLWDAVKDNFVKSNDYPCNNVVYFSSRAGKLDITVVMRSNDLIWGTPYNMCQFSHLQALIAGSLCLEVGEYSVMVNNLHFYTGLYPDTLTVVKGWCRSVQNASMNLQEYSETVFPTWDMRWDLHCFDEFVSRVWDSLEKEMRYMVTLWKDSDGAEPDAYFIPKLDYLNSQMLDFGVPAYWQHVFHVLFMWHCRKAGALSVYTDLLLSLPSILRWAVEDFTAGVKPL